MSRQQIVSYSVTCDVCGAAIPESDIDDASRGISWQGAGYQVDLCSDRQAQLAETLERIGVFAAAGQRNGGTRGRRGAGSSAPRSRPASSGSATPGAAGRRSDLAVIRSWAQENGHQVGDRGRLPRIVVDAYDEAAAGAATVSAPRRRRTRKVPAAAS